MTMHALVWSSGAGLNLFNNLGGILSGLSELLIAIGGGVGFVVRMRRNARREHLRTEAAASLAAQRAKEALEAKLDQQHKDQIDQMRHAGDDAEEAHRAQILQLEEQLRVQQRMNINLLNKLLGKGSEDDHTGG